MPSFMDQILRCALLLAALFGLSRPGLLGAAPVPAAAFLTQSALLPLRAHSYDGGAPGSFGWLFDEQNRALQLAV